MDYDVILEVEDLKTLEDVFEEVRRRLPPTLKKFISRRSNRRKLLAMCGEKAFLVPSKLKFPVMDQKCRYNCGLLYAAYVRARQWSGKRPGYRQIAAKAKELFDREGCAKKVGLHIEGVGVIDLERFMELSDE